MKAFLKFVVLGLCAFGLSTANAWEKKKPVEAAKSDPDTVKSVRYEGETDLDMLKAVRSDLESALAKDSKIKVLRVDLMSPGGPVVTSLEIARLLREAHDKKGLTVEIHASGVCASGCTFVLASGTPNFRYVTKRTLILVHPIQSGSFFGGMTCVSHTEDASTQNDKVINALIDALRDTYMDYTGQDQKTVEGWLTCGNEQAGQGQLAVDLKLADKVE